MVESAADKLVATWPGRREQHWRNGLQPHQLGNGFHADAFRPQIHGSVVSGQRAYNYGGYWFWNDDPGSLKEMEDQMGGAVWEKLRTIGVNIVRRLIRSISQRHF